MGPRTSDCSYSKRAHHSSSRTRSPKFLSSSGKSNSHSPRPPRLLPESRIQSSPPSPWRKAPRPPRPVEAAEVFTPPRRRSRQPLQAPLARRRRRLRRRPPPGTTRLSSTSIPRWRTRCSRRGTRSRGGSSAAASSTPRPARTSRCSTSPPPRSPTRSASRPPSELSPPASIRSLSPCPRSHRPRRPLTRGSFSCRPRPRPRCSASTRSSASCCARTRASRCPTRSDPTTGYRGAPSPSMCPAAVWPRPFACSVSSSCSPSLATGWTSHWSRSRRPSGRLCPTRSAAAAVLEPTKRRCCNLYNVKNILDGKIIFNKVHHHRIILAFPCPFHAVHEKPSQKEG